MVNETESVGPKRKPDKFLKMAEKIADGLEKSNICTGVKSDKQFNSKPENIHLKFREITKKELMIAIADAIYNEITYGCLGTLTLRRENGAIVAKLYFHPDGTLAEDSWLCNEGLKQTANKVC